MSLPNGISFHPAALAGCMSMTDGPRCGNICNSGRVRVGWNGCRRIFTNQVPSPIQRRQSTEWIISEWEPYWNYYICFSRCRQRGRVPTRDRTAARCRPCHQFRFPCTICSSPTANLPSGTAAEWSDLSDLSLAVSSRSLFLCCRTFAFSHHRTDVLLTNTAEPHVNTEENSDL